MRQLWPLLVRVSQGFARLSLLQALGAKVIIFERADELGEIGASLQLSPNATHILSDLGLLPALQNHWIEPQSINMIDGVSLKPIKTLPIANMSGDEWHAPYAMMARTDLQRELLGAVQKAQNCDLHLSSELDFTHIDALQTDYRTKIRSKARPDHWGRWGLV